MDGYAYGVWAGDLAYHDGTWYCCQSDPHHGLFISSTTNIHGPWSEPLQLLPAGKVLDDPSMFWDDAGKQAYLLCNVGRIDPKKPDTENRLFKMSWDGRKLLDEGVPVFSGNNAEASKIYRINGVWYLFFAEWFVEKDKPLENGKRPSDRRQVVLRSKTGSIYGPYEKKIVLKRGNGIKRSCSQGALMQAPDKSWWYIHQLIQNCPSPFQGRPQCLEPVTWVDGWPIIGQDVDGDGIGEPVLQHRKPIAGFPVTAPPSSDEFEAPALGLQWEWNHNPRDTHWSLTERPGWLRLKASLPVSDAAHSRKGARNLFWRACNTLSQRTMGTSGTAVARFDMAGMKPGQRAGMVRFGGVYHLLGVRVDDAGRRQLFFQDNAGKETAGPELTGDSLYVRTVNSGDQAYFETSEDGQAFTRLGPEFTLVFGAWTGDRIGFFCWNEKAEAGWLDVDYLHYNYDGPRHSKGDDLK
jgi:beta-xylosidase